MTGLLMMAPLVLGGGLAQAQAIALPAHAIPGIQQDLNLHGVHQKKAKRKGFRPIIRGCPKLVARELHIVRAVPQPGHPDHYSFILDGTIENRGLTGQASAGFNVSRKLNGRVVHRVALSLFEKQVRHNQRFDLNRDFPPSRTLHLPIQSQAISRADASHSTFELSVTNLSNHQGKCSVYNPTVATVSSGKVRQALPAQLHGGVSQQVGTLKKNGASAARKPLFGRSKPVTRRGGKSLLSPHAKGGTRHLLNAGIRLDSVTPTITTAGASVTVHGQFPGVSMSDSRFEYNLFLYPRGGSFRDDALMHITRISMTALTATVPNHNPGNFLLRIDTRVRGNDFATPTRSNSIPITIRRSLSGFAPKPMFGHGSGRPVTGPGGTSLTDRTQMKLGSSGFVPKPMFGPGSGRPVTGPHGTSLTERAQMRLSLIDMIQNNEIIRNGITLNRPIQAEFLIENKGTATGFVTVHRMLGSSPAPGDSQFKGVGFGGGGRASSGGVAASSPAPDGSKIFEVDPGGVITVGLNIIVHYSDRDVYSGATGSGGHGSLRWRPMFMLLSATNAPYSDSNMTDNTVRSGAIPITSPLDISVLNPLLHSTPYAGGEGWDEGTEHPTTLDFTVKVKNNELQASEPQFMYVTVRGTGETGFPHGFTYDSGFGFHPIGACDSWPICQLKYHTRVPAIQAGQEHSFVIHFDNIPHRIVLARAQPPHHGAVKVAIGPYLCRGVSAEIIVKLKDSPRGNNNIVYVYDGSFAGGVVPLPSTSPDFSNVFDCHFNYAHGHYQTYLWTHSQ